MDEHFHGRFRKLPGPRGVLIQTPPLHQILGQQHVVIAEEESRWERTLGCRMNCTISG